MGDDEFLRQFESGAWPAEDWHHRQHVKVAYLYLRSYPPNEAISRMRSGIRAYNAVHQVPDSLTSGYHETITLAWMRLVQAALRESGPAKNADAFVDMHSQLACKRTLLLYYSRERIMSADAKRQFVEPDLAPLPPAANPENAALPDRPREPPTG